MPDTVNASPKQNRILGALPAKEYSRIADDLSLVELTRGEILYRPGDEIRHVYFPTTCVASLIFTAENGSQAELAMTGNDGLIGFPLVLGGETTTHGIVVQSDGRAYRLRAEVLNWELDQGGNLQRVCLAYVQALMTQMAQGVVCNRYHSIDQQLCRWLLHSLNQLPGDELHFTQELIASMLGVRREGITEAAGNLQTAGLISYRRGRITVVDRAGLEARVCECYHTVKAEYDRLFHLLPTGRERHRVRPSPSTLRRRAEARLQQASATASANPSWDSVRMLHELQVHEIELELHNEELRQAYDEVDALRARYADIYDFAPVAYFTVDRSGVVVQLNLTGAILLGIKRSQGGRCRFSAFVQHEFLRQFASFLEDVLDGRNKRKCELVLAATEQRGETKVSIKAIADESGTECRMVVMETPDATQRETDLRVHEA